MNKTIIIVLGIVVAVALILGAAGLFVAMQNRSAANGRAGFGMMPFYGANQSFQGGQYGRGMMGGQTGRGMMGGNGFQSDAYASRVNMQSYMITALAAELDVTEDELSTELNKGTSMLEMPSIQELTVKEFNTKLVAARTAAVDQALADGVITKIQADAMKDAQGGWMMGGFGFGFRR